MIPTEIFMLACAIGKCGPEDDPDEECIAIAWELAKHLKSNGYYITRINPQT